MTDINKFCLDSIQRIKNDWGVLTANWQDAIKFYDADPTIVDIIKGRSKVTTTDFQDTVEWVKSSLLEILASGDEIVSLEPASSEDVEGVKLHEVLLNKQIRRKNKWFLVLHDFLDDLLKFKFGTIKYQWIKDIKEIDKEYDGLTVPEFQMKAAQPNTQVLSYEETPVSVDEMGMPIVSIKATFRFTVEDERPLIEAIPSDEIGFPLKSKSLSEAPFLYHRRRYNKWAFIDRFGEKNFNKVEEMTASSQSPYGNEVDKFADLGGVSFFYIKEDDEWEVYECYFRHPDTGEQWIHTICGDIDMDSVKNRYSQPPFEGATPIKIGHRHIGKSLYDILREIQKIRTTMLRQIYDNVYQANFRRYFVDPDRISMDDYLNNNTTNAVVRVVGDPSTAVMPEQKAPLPPEVFNFWETLNMERDYHNIIPRSFQGVNSRQLNDTWRGQNQQITQASQRIQMLVRMISEMCLAPLMSDLFDCNLRFLKKSTMVRYMNKWVEVTPDNIVSSADAVVKVGLGVNQKADTISQMQQLIGLYAQVFKAGVPVVTPVNVYNVLSELVKAMGHQDISNYVTDPKQFEAQKTLFQMALQLLPLTGGNPQMLQTLMQIAGTLGIPFNPQMMMQQPQQQASGVSGRNFAGQNTPAQPLPPVQANQPVTTPSGGGYFG